MTMMTVMLESVSRKTLKKPLVSRWYSVGGFSPGDDGGHECDRATSQAPLCEATNLYKNLHNLPEALHQLEIIFRLEKIKLSGDVVFKFSLV